VAAEITFLMGQDGPASSNPFYSLAKQYFQAGSGTVVDAPAAGQTLEGVFKTLRGLNAVQTTINLVSHAQGFGGMECSITEAKRPASGVGVMTADDLQDAVANKGLTAPGPAVISDKTRVVIYGCDVGRSSRFLTMLSGVFGNPGELLGPRRVGVFISDGATVKYRQAQTWSLARKAPLVVAGTQAPAQGWPTFRTSFVNDASSNFGRATAGIDDPFALDTLTKILTTAASQATTTAGNTFFFEEGIDIEPAAGQTAEQAAQSIGTATNGDPPTSPAATVGQIDDTTVVTNVGPADTYPTTPAKTAYRISVVILAQIIDKDVVIAQGTDYQCVTSSKGRAPSPGPKAASADGDNGGGGDDADPLQTATQLLLAGGVSQADIDALLASAPTGDATEDIDTDAPATVPVDGDTGSGFPPRLETA
jgi:hypothetical protein